MSRSGHLFYAKYLAGKDDHDDVKRREYVLNVLLLGISIAGIFAGLVLAVLSAMEFDVSRWPSYIELAAVVTAALLLLRLSRVGKHALASRLFLTCLFIAAFKYAYYWGFNAPTFALGLALIITVAGVVLQSRTALLLSLSAASSMLIVGFFQSQGMFQSAAVMSGDILQFTDAVGYTLLLSLVSFVSWLANAEIDRSLIRAHESRSALLHERNTLEERVAARTLQLEQLQTERLMELQRFADFGRLTAHLLHEVSNPLTAASLHLQLLDTSQLAGIKQVRKNIKHIERYVNYTRKQLKNQSHQSAFSVRSEVRQAVSILAPLANRAKVKLEIQPFLADLRLYGDPVKFTQIFANIAINAIDAMSDPDFTNSNRVLEVKHKVRGRYLEITFKDNGKGISDAQLPYVFEPFYTTKDETHRGLGIGLSLVKKAVQDEYSGSIKVKSKLNHGTVFTVRLRLNLNSPKVTSYKKLTIDDRNNSTPMLYPLTVTE